MQRSRLVSTTLGLGILVVALVMALAAQEQVAERKLASRSVRVAPVESGAATQALRFAGTVRSRDRASLAFTVGGRLARRVVELGDSVRRGEVLAVLDGREWQHAAASARASREEIAARLIQLERDAEREVRLLATRAATEEDVERARAAVDAVRASRDAALAREQEAERRLGEATLTAPWAGTVTEVRAEPGENVAAGEVVLVISGAGDLEVEIAVPEALVAALAPGTAVRVELPLRDQVLAASVRSVGRAAAGPGQLFPVVVALGEAIDVPPGSTAEVVIATGGAASLSVPLAAILNPGGARPAVFRLREGHAERVLVEVVSLTGERAVVRGPLAAGELVVVAGHTSLVDGDPVAVSAGDGSAAEVRP